MRVVLGFGLLVAGVGIAGASLNETDFSNQTNGLTPDVLKTANTVQAPGDEASFPLVDAPVDLASSRATPDTTGDFWTISTTRPTSALDVATRRSLALDIEMKLARLGCYDGPVDGEWSSRARDGAQRLLNNANAQLDTGEPDFALFSLVQSASPDLACGPAASLQVADRGDAPAPPMSLGGPGSSPSQGNSVSARHYDRGVQDLFTNPLGR